MRRQTGEGRRERGEGRGETVKIQDRRPKTKDPRPKTSVSPRLRVSPSPSPRLLSILLLTAALPALAADSFSFSPPPETLHVDFTTANTSRRVAFLDEGLAIEVPAELHLILRPKHGQNDKVANPPLVKIEATLPEDGRFEVVSTNAAMAAEIRNVRVEKGIGRAEIVARAKVMTLADATCEAERRFERLWKPAEDEMKAACGKLLSREVRGFLVARLGPEAYEAMVELYKPADEHDPAKARERAQRELYVFERTLEKVAPDLRKELEQVAERRPVWVAPADKQKWKTANGRALYDALVQLLECEVMDEHLKQCGMGVETNTRNYREKLETTFRALEVVASGRVANDPQAAQLIARAFTTADRKRLSEALWAPLRCRFYPAVDERDANAQWFNGQRIACRAQGVSVIRVAGRLDPAAHDRTDWWILEDYNAATVTFVPEKQSAVRIEPPLVTDRGTLIRVVAAGERAAEYAFELRAAAPPPDAIKVVIYETPSRTEVKFPF